MPVRSRRYITAPEWQLVDTGYQKMAKRSLHQLRT